MQGKTEEEIDAELARKSPVYRFWQRWKVPISLVVVLWMVCAIVEDIFSRGGPHYPKVAVYTVFMLCHMVVPLKLDRYRRWNLCSIAVAQGCMMYFVLAR